MKIAIDTIPLLSPLTGVGYYTLKISQTLREIGPQNQYLYYYGFYSPSLLLPGETPEPFHRLKDWVLALPAAKHAARSVKDLGIYFSSRRFDLYFEPNFVPIGIPARRILAAVPDFSFARFPEWHTAEKVRYFEKHFWKKIQEAHGIIVLSDFIKAEAVRRFGMAENRIFAIPLGVDSKVFRKYPSSELEAVRSRYRLPDDFILFVGSIEPRKNLKRLLQAHRNLVSPLRKKFKLVLAGSRGWKNEEVMDAIQDSPAEAMYLGYVPENELGRLYNLARLLIYPSLYEGFGLPPLEAMACGCPVVVSEAASLPEICGEAAAYVNPLDVNQMAEAMRRVLEDEDYRKSLMAKGLARAAGFTWERSAREHLRAFEKVSQE